MRHLVPAAVILAAAWLGQPSAVRADCHRHHHRIRRSYSVEVHYGAWPSVGYYGGFARSDYFYSPYSRFHYRRHRWHHHGIRRGHGGYISVYRPWFGIGIGFGPSWYGHYHHDVYFPHSGVGYHYHVFGY
ncbi:MAG TPA: hypothetical protein EYP14_09980 [Planctomycetaceae bacterium]|nr:hypothetical protein [Planctomycetaceae bacterium]